MAHTTLSSILQGGDRRSLGRANQVAALVLGQPKRFPELLECMWCDDPVVRMRAADAAERISEQRGFGARCTLEAAAASGLRR
jgi:hypothetical protein